MWIRILSEYDVLFRLLPNLRFDGKSHCWVDLSVARGHNWDTREDKGQINTEVKIVFPMSGHRSRRGKRGAGERYEGGLTEGEVPSRGLKNEAEGQLDAGMSRSAAEKPRKPACGMG
jgi:hypothetical protein